MPTLRSVLTNLRAPMPLGPKAARTAANNWVKRRTRVTAAACLASPGAESFAQAARVPSRSRRTARRAETIPGRQ
jgi:hypothetical protein